MNLPRTACFTGMVLCASLAGCQSVTVPAMPPAEESMARRLEALGARVQTAGGEVIGVYFFHTHRRLTDADLKLLTRCPQLREVWLHGTHVTDEGLLALASCKTLERVELPISSNISEATVLEFQRRLPRCRVERIGTGNLGTTANDS